MLINYKSSGNKIPQLSEETFSTDPTSRGWSIDNNGYSLNYSASGLNIGIQGSSTITFTLENTNIRIKKYLSFIFDAGNSGDCKTGPTISLYLNDISFGSINVGKNDERSGGVVFSVYKNTKNDWYRVYGGNRWTLLADFIYGQNSINLNSDIIKSIKIVVSSKDGYGNMYLKNLKWA